MASVGKASLALEGKEIMPGRVIGVGTVGEMMRQKAEWRKDRITIGGGGKEREGHMKTTAALMPTGLIKRPVQPGARRGGRGGLGIRRGGVGLSGARAATGVKAVAVEGVEAMDVDQDKRDGKEGGAGSGKPKSNSDFKAMFLKNPKGADESAKPQEMEEAKE